MENAKKCFQKMVILSNACGQTELPDRYILIRQKLVKNANIENT